MYSRVTVEPTVEPITLAETKLHMRIASAATDQDALITSLIVAARKRAEAYTGRSFITQTRELGLDYFGQTEDPNGWLSLPYGPVQSISGITYLDTDGALQTLATGVYQSDLLQMPARLWVAYGQYWPPTRYQFNAVTITYVAGYAPGSGSPTDYAANVPEDIKHALKIMVANLSENREELTGVISALLDPYRVALI